MFGVDYSLACMAHDMSYLARDWRLKARSDLALFLDVWACATVADTPVERVGLRVNACLMGLAVSTVGWLYWLPKFVIYQTDMAIGEL